MTTQPKIRSQKNYQRWSQTVLKGPCRGPEASSRTTSSADCEAPPLAAILEGLGGLTQKADNNSLRFGEEIGGLHKEKAELNPEMTGLTESMDNITRSKRSQTTFTELMKPKERMDKDGSWRRQTNYAEWCSTDDERKTMEPSEVGGEWCPTFITLAPWVTDWGDPEKRTLFLFSTSHFAREEPRAPSLQSSRPDDQCVDARRHPRCATFTSVCITSCSSLPAQQLSHHLGQYSFLVRSVDIGRRGSTGTPAPVILRASVCVRARSHDLRVL